VLCGKVDAIILTGGLVYSDYIVEKLRERIEYLAPVYCYPGENEMEALAMNALAVLRGEFTTKDYDQGTTL
jgi:butyrate kinase